MELVYKTTSVVTGILHVPTLIYIMYHRLTYVMCVTVYM